MPTPPPPKKPFPIQAAQFCFWAPLAGMMLSVVVNTSLNTLGGNRDMPGKSGEGIAVLFIIILLNITGIALGVFALLRIPKYGKSGILVRSLLGILFSSLVLSTIGYLHYRELHAGDPVEQLLVGQWRSVVKQGAEMDLFLGPDKRALIALKIEPSHTITLKGTWTMTRHVNIPSPELQVQWDHKDPRLGDGMKWLIQRISDETLELELRNHDGTTSFESYARQR